MDPEALASRREWPTLSIVLETADGGATWKQQGAPIFGELSRYRHSASAALSLIRFTNAFDWPSEVNLIRNGKGTRIHRDKDRKVTDVGWLDKAAILAAIEPPGRLYQLPVPGKVHVLYSRDLNSWKEMKVDYRAFGRELVLSVVDEKHAWMASDSGQILNLEN
jgi:hypothetical protein